MKKTIEKKNIKCCNIIGHHSCLVFRYKIQPKTVSCTTSKCMYKYIMTEKMKEKNCLKKNIANQKNIQKWNTEAYVPAVKKTEIKSSKVFKVQSVFTVIAGGHT